MTVMKIFVACKYSSLANTLSLVFKDDGFDIIDAPGGSAGLKLLTQVQPSIVLLTAQIALMEDCSFVKQCLRLTRQRIPIVVIDVPVVVKRSLKALGVAAFLDIPLSLNDLRTCFEMVIPSRL
jgi:DNA-binding response OmpR family regulator